MMRTKYECSMVYGCCNHRRRGQQGIEMTDPARLRLAQDPRPGWANQRCRSPRCISRRAPRPAPPSKVQSRSRWKSTAPSLRGEKHPALLVLGTARSLPARQRPCMCDSVRQARSIPPARGFGFIHWPGAAAPCGCNVHHVVVCLCLSPSLLPQWEIVSCCCTKRLLVALHPQAQQQAQQQPPGPRSAALPPMDLGGLEHSAPTWLWLRSVVRSM